MTDTIQTTANRLIPFTPAALEKRDPKPVIWLKVPTPDDRDNLTATLYRMGLREITNEVFRATLIDELYNVFPEDQADEYATLLDTYWQTSALDAEAFTSWHEQEVQRLIDEAAGAKDLVKQPQPIPVTSPRTAARARLLVEEVQDKSKRLQDLIIRRVDHARLQALCTVRLGVARIDGLSVAVTKDANGNLTEDSAHRIRAAVPDLAWRQLVAKIESGYDLEEEERKNSDSPPESGSDQIGSQEPSAASESSDGRWTDSSTGLAPTVESDTITG